MNQVIASHLFLDDHRACSWIRDYVNHFAHPVRLKVLCPLMQGPACVSELVESTEERQSTVSQQLKNLLLAGLIEREGRGTRNYYRIADATIPETMRFLAEIARQASGSSRHR